MTLKYSVSHFFYLVGYPPMEDGVSFNPMGDGHAKGTPQEKYGQTNKYHIPY